MYVVSCCQIYTFHLGLNLDKIVIFRSFQQNKEEIYDLSHIKKEHVPSFDKTTFFQLKDAVSAVLAREKLTSLAELVSAELKFIVNTLNDWFTNITKPKFLNWAMLRDRFSLKKTKLFLPKQHVVFVDSYSM